MLTIPNGSLVRVMPRTSYGPGSYVRQAATTAHTRGRLYYFYGLQQGPSIDILHPVVDAVAGGLFPTYAGTFLQQLQADGWEVIVSPDVADFTDPGPTVSGQWNNALINPDMRDDPAQGARYVATMLTSFDTLMARVNADHGWLPTIVGGGSWGGFTACQIAAKRAMLGDGSPLAGFFAQLTPVVLGNVLNISGSVFPFPTPGADLGTLTGNPLPFSGGTWTSTFLNSVRVPGRVTHASQDTTVYCGGSSVMAQNAVAAGAPLASRVCDATITGGTSFSSVGFCAGGSNENGAVMTSPNPGIIIPSGTTLSGLTDVSGNGSGPWTGTLSKTCPNTAPIAVTNVGTNGSQVVYTTTTAHGRSVGDTIVAYGFTSTGSTTSFGIAETPSPFNMTAVVVAVTTNTITVNSTASGTTTVFGSIGPAFSFPGLAPGYNNSHFNTGFPEYVDLVNWIKATLDPLYPMVL